MRNVTPQNWQEVVKNLLDLADISTSAKGEENVFRNTAQLLQTLIDSNAPEGDKMAIFVRVMETYRTFENTSPETKAKISQMAEQARARKAKIQAENDRLQELENLPFYFEHKSNLGVICIEDGKNLDDKLQAFSCILDTLQAIPALFEQAQREQVNEGVFDRLSDVLKLYARFTAHQYELLRQEVSDKLDEQGGKKC